MLGNLNSKGMLQTASYNLSASHEDKHLELVTDGMRALEEMLEG
jgi:hypothetical protein